MSIGAATLADVPEMLEVELYRRSASAAEGGRIGSVEAIDPVWNRRAPDLAERLIGCRVTAVRRHGKVLLVETDGPTLALRFGMTGRLLVDGVSAVADLAYGAHGDDPRWMRLAMTVRRGRSTVRWEVSDPRRLGWSELDPDLARLGPDAWGIDETGLAERCRGRSAPIKAALLDQAMVAGLGNMLADEVLLRAGIAPTRPVRSLDGAEVAALADALAVALPEMLAAGGSHTGHLSPALRVAGAACPLDGDALRRSTIGGRTTVWCPAHQR